MLAIAASNPPISVFPSGMGYIHSIHGLLSNLQRLRPFSLHESIGNNVEPKVKAAVGYVRVSTSNQALGLDAQRAEIDAYAARHGLTLASWHEDHLSGSTPAHARPGLTTAVAEAVGTGAVLIVAKRDRLARDPLITMTVERELSRRGSALVSADGTGNGASPADALMRGVVDAVAAYERELIRARTRAALAAARAAGTTLGRPKYGVRAGEDALVQRARELSAQGLSSRAVAEALTNEGYRTRKGTTLRSAQVCRLLAA